MLLLRGTGSLRAGRRRLSCCPHRRRCDRPRDAKLESVAGEALDTGDPELALEDLGAVGGT
jgi:hypothetical protein